MRREVLFLVAGLAAVAALPVQESAASTLQDNLLKILLSVNPEGNDLFAEDGDKLPVSPTKTGEDAPHEVIMEQPQQQTEPQDHPQEQTQPQDPPKEQKQTQPQDPPEEQKQTQPQDPPKEQKQTQPQDLPKEQKQAQLQDPPKEQKQAEPQDPPQEQIQPEPQVHEMEPAQDSSLPDGTEDESHVKESMLDALEVRPEPQPILVDPHEDLPIGPGDLEENEATYADPEMEGLPFGPDDDYVLLHVKEETPSQDMEGTFTYGVLVEKAPFDQEAGPHLFSPEEFPSEPQKDSIAFESEPQMQPFSVQLQPQMDPLSYHSEVSLSQEGPPSSDPQTESNYEQLPLEIKEGSDNEYDDKFPADTYQPNSEDNMSLEPERVPAEGSYYSDHADVPVDLLSWLVPDFFDEEPTDYDESLYDSSYYDQVPVVEDRTPDKPEALLEPQVSDVAKWEEPSISDIHGATDYLDESLLESGGDMVVVEAVPLGTTDFSQREGTDDVSLVDFFIPTYGNPKYSSVPQEYSSNATPDDEDEEFVSSNEETFPVDDGLIQMEPFLKIDMVELEQDEPDTVLFGDDNPSEYGRYISPWSTENDRVDLRELPEQPDTMVFGEVLSENNPSEDGRYIASWSTESDRADQRELLEGNEAVTILETQPIPIPDMETDVSYPSLLEVLEKDAEAEELDGPWSDTKSSMTDFAPEADTMVDDSLHMERDYLSEDPDDDAIEIIKLNDPRENFDNFPATPLAGGSHSTQSEPTPMAWYSGDHYQQPYWAPYRTSDRPIPKVYYSGIDEVPRKKFPGFFGRMNDLTLSLPMSNRPRETAVTGNPFSFMNEIPDDEMPPQFLASIITSGQHKFRGPDSLFSARNYPDTFTTPRLSFRDLMQSLNPSYYNTMYVNDIQRPSLYYRQSYNPFLRYNGLRKQRSHTSPPLPYFSPFDSFQDNNYLVDEDYYPNRLERLSSYKPSNMPSGIFREDTMPEMYSHGPQRHYKDYTIDVPSMSSYSYSSPRSLFPVYEKPHYESNSPSFNRPYYSQNSHYNTGPYHPTPIYPRYAPKYYGM